MVESKRVGTLTVGIFLVALGVLLLAQLIVHTSFMHTLIDIWPVILIALGIEILYYRYRASRDDKMRYDIVSMLVLLLVGISAVGLYTLQASGLFDIVRNIPNYGIYNIEITPEKIPVGGDIDHIVIENNLTDLQLKVAESGDVGIYGNINMFATSRDEARRLVKDDKGYRVYQQGRDLVVETHQAEPKKWFLNGGMKRSSLEITIPANIALDIDSFSGNINLTADKILNDWFVKESNGELNVTLPKGSGANIVAEANQVAGDIFFKEQGKIAGGSNNDTSTVLSNLQDRRFEVQLGKGGSHLHLVNPGGTIAVYQR